MLNVLNDKTKGLELLKEAKIVKDSLRQDMMENKDEINLETSPVPFICVSATKKDKGNILQLNQLFTTLFGY